MGVWFSRCLALDQANPSGEQILHHALLDLAGFGELGLESGNLRIHVKKLFTYCILFVTSWK